MSKHGGARPNSGRPKALPEGARYFGIRVTDAEREAIRALIDRMRSQKPPKARE